MDHWSSRIWNEGDADRQSLNYLGTLLQPPRTWNMGEMTQSIDQRSDSNSVYRHFPLGNTFENQADGVHTHNWLCIGKRGYFHAAFLGSMAMRKAGTTLIRQW